MKNMKFIKCAYCGLPTLEKDIKIIEGVKLCKFCLEDKKRPKDYLPIKNKKPLKTKKTISHKGNQIEEHHNNKVSTRKDNDEDYDFHLHNKEDERCHNIYPQSFDDEDEIKQLYDDTLERDAFEFSDPDDYYRNDDYDNESLWYDKDDLYDDGWRR